MLVCTLGASWSVVPEVFAAVAPEACPLFRHHPDRERLDRVRRACGDPAIAELWLVTTGGERPRQALEQLRAWWSALATPIPLRVWRAADTEEVATSGELERLRELTFRVVLHATGAEGDGAILSLAGGRKTMSADLQRAASLFGCRGLLHVVVPEPLPPGLQELGNDPAAWTRPLPRELVEAVAPAYLGGHRRLEALDVDPPVVPDHFPLPLPKEDGTPRDWPPPGGPEASLVREVDRREREGSRLLGNFLGRVAREEPHEGWRSLYRLPPRQVQQLREAALGPEDRDWLLRLPKADLHRHLGGCLDLAAQRRVARAVWEALSPPERAAATEAVRELLAQPPRDWAWGWPDKLTAACGKLGIERSHRAACLLVELGEELEAALFGPTEPRLGVKHRHPKGFSAYERPGELTGSAILQHPAAIAPYARALVEQARAEGLAYVELRGSPQKYLGGDGGVFLRQFKAALAEAGAEVAADSDPFATRGDPEPPRPPRPWFRFLVIADRRDPAAAEGAVELAVRMHAELDGFVVGLDLAGDEGAAAPEDLEEAFEPAFHDCLPVTIHAGEGEPADSIWSAAYRLHADRIGHGLTLAAAPELARRFRDRRICLELCPTSNREVVGYRDPAVADSRDLPDYPLRQLWDLGLHLTLCTDNPAISRTTLADEYLTAARMDGRLTRWEALTLMKHAFVHAFLPADERERLTKAADAEVFRLLAGPPR
ncbi:MAG: adenosine deaminase [Nitrospirae bacterium]|nr:MAG: adenosine deaminase [Nitrospirota bacterium]